MPERRVLVGSLTTIGSKMPALFAPTPPEAVICGSDSLAVIVHAAALRAGLRPGTDIAITGFDAVPLCVEPDPPLTSVALPIASAAERIVHMVIDQIGGAPPPEVGEMLPTHLVVGETT